MAKKYLFLLLFVFGAFAEEIEIRLPTASPVKPAYVSGFHSESTELSVAYLESLRSVLVFDLNTGGFVAVQPRTKIDAERTFDVGFWRREKVPYVFSIRVVDKKLELTAFDVEKGSSKRYPSVLLTGRLDADRQSVHQLSDKTHKDLFQSEGIASLRLLYSERTKDPSKKTDPWVSEIWMQEYDGTNNKRMTFENAYCITPAFYPHTAGMSDPSFVYVSYKGGQSKIYGSTASGKSQTLVDLRGSQFLPSINLQGTHIAFIADAAGRPDLFIQALDKKSKPKQLFSAPRASQASSTFSPDGRRIAFVSDKDGPPRIYCMDITAKRSRIQLLTRKNRENISPSWSPDGKKLAFSAKVDGVRQIWIYDFETDEEMPLTSGTINKENPAWAPDSLHLVFNTDADEKGELFLINLHQKEAIQITKGPGQKRFPSWESR
jgi:TolB protein